MLHELNAFCVRFLPKTFRRRAVLYAGAKNTLFNQRITPYGKPVEARETPRNRAHGPEDHSTNGRPKGPNGRTSMQKRAVGPVAYREPLARCVHPRWSCGPHCPELGPKGGENGQRGPQRRARCTQRAGGRTQRAGGCTLRRRGAFSLKRNPLPRSSSPPSSQRASWPLPS